MDFAVFVKAYAWIFYRGVGSGGEDSDDDVDDSSNGGETDDVARGRARSDPAKRERGRRRTPSNTSRGGGGRGRSGSEKSSRRLGYGGTDMGGSRDRSRNRGRGRGRSHSGVDGAIGIGEEAELRRWEKRLGQKQMRRLERVFNEWAVDDAGGDGGGAGATVEVRDLERCFKELGRDDVHLRELRAWCDEVDLAPGDALSLADFAYAYHSMFVDAGGEGA